MLPRSGLTRRPQASFTGADTEVLGSRRSIKHVWPRSFTFHSHSLLITCPKTDLGRGGCPLLDRHGRAESRRFKNELPPAADESHELPTKGPPTPRSCVGSGCQQYLCSNYDALRLVRTVCFFLPLPFVRCLPRTTFKPCNLGPTVSGVHIDADIYACTTAPWRQVSMG